jgi:hypothetical protein
MTQVLEERSFENWADEVTKFIFDMMAVIDAQDVRVGEPLLTEI